MIWGVTAGSSKSSGILKVFDRLASWRIDGTSNFVNKCFTGFPLAFIGQAEKLYHWSFWWTQAICCAPLLANRLIMTGCMAMSWPLRVEGDEIWCNQLKLFVIETNKATALDATMSRIDKSKILPTDILASKAVRDEILAQDKKRHRQKRYFNFTYYDVEESS